MMNDEELLKELKWDQFCGNLLGYINDYYEPYYEVDYEIKLDMSYGEIWKELQNSKCIDDLSPQLKKIALQYKNHPDYKITQKKDL